jgi:hypothetical protein
VPCTPEVPPAGFGYPLGGVSLLGPLEVSFNLQRSWASPYRAFFLSDDRTTLSNRSLRSCAFPQNLPALYRRSSGLVPSEKRSPLASLDSSSRPGSHALLGLRASRAFPPEDPCPERLSRDMPLSLLNDGDLTISILMSLRGLRPFGSAFPLTGCRPVWPSNRLRWRSLRKCSFLRAIFSPRKEKTPLGTSCPSLSKKLSPA